MHPNSTLKQLTLTEFYCASYPSIRMHRRLVDIRVRLHSSMEKVYFIQSNVDLGRLSLQTLVCIERIGKESLNLFTDSC